MHTRSIQLAWRTPLLVLSVFCLLLVSFSTQTFAKHSPALKQSQKIYSGEIPGGLTQSEWSSIKTQITATKYRAYQDEQGGYTSHNPSQGWQIRYRPDGLTVLTPFDTSTTNYRLGLKLNGVGYAQLEEFHRPQEISAKDTTVYYQWNNNLREFWINSQGNLEQWFVLEQRPSDAVVDLPLTLQLTLDSDLHATQVGNTIRFKDQNGTAITYSELVVWDSNGKIMPAQMQLANHVINLTVNEADAVYPLTIDPTVQQAYIKASNTDAGDSFAEALAISGDTLVVGAHNERSNARGVNGDQSDNSLISGAAYVFIRNAGVWTQQAYLKSSNSDQGDRFGSSVAVSGDTIVVGALFEDSSATGVNGNEADNSMDAAGAAYVFVRNAGVWTQQAYLKASSTTTALGGGDHFGEFVAISADTVVVGAQLEDSLTGVPSDNSGINPGAVYVFTRSGTTWSQQAYLKASNLSNQDRFGCSVAISGDTVVIGAEDQDTTASASGAVYVFTRSDTTWTEQAFLKASNPGFNDGLGWSVDVSGDTLVAGAHQESSNATGVNGDETNDLASQSGAAYVFTRSGSVWGQQAYLKASNTDSSDKFGESVAIDGDTIIVGAYQEDSAATGVNGDDTDNSASLAGAAYVFTRSGTTWSQRDYLKASNTDVNDRFGFSVAVSGDTQVVGSFWEASSATGINGNDADNSASLAGAAYIFAASADGPADQNITGFTATPSVGVVGGSSTLSATASSGLAVTFDSNTPTICTVAGSTVSYLAVGTCTVTADQAGDATYNPAPQVTLNIGVGLTDQVITNFVATPSTGVVNESSTLSAAGGASGNPVVFGSNTMAVCTVAGSTVTYVTAGTCTVTADQAGNASFNAAPTVALDITVAKADQTITGLAANPATGVAGGTSALSATASSGLAVTFGSSTSAVCTVAGSTVTYVTAGTCTVTADQAGDANYNAALQVTIDITVAKADQTITGLAANPATGVVEGSSTLSATASSGLTVSFGSSTPTVCTVTGATVSYLAAGICTVTADQAGDAAYNTATQVTLDISVAKADQTISGFTADPASGVIGGTSTLSVSSAAAVSRIAQSGQKLPTTKASGIPVTYGSNTLTICTVTGSTVSYLAVGTCTVIADQAGDANYNPAPQVTLDINVIELIPNVPIPTLSLWGLVAMFLMMLGVGGMIVRRKTSG